MRLAVLLALLAACEGNNPLTETGNPDLEGTLAILARTTAPEAVSIEGSAPTDVTEATVAVERARLVMGEVCDAPGEIEWDVPVPASVDLVAGSGAIPFDLKSGDYCRVRVRLDGDGDVLVVAGTRTDGALYEIRSRERFEVDVRSKGEPFSLEEGTNRLLLAFDVARWLAGVPLDTAVADGDGVVRIDDASNESVLAAFEAAVLESLALVSDDDGDEQVDTDEPELATSSP